MVPAHYSIPQQKITVTHNATDYELQNKTLSCKVTLRENAVSSAVFEVNDYKSKTYLSKCDVADNVKIEMKYKDGTDTYTQVFGGWIENLVPSLTDKEAITVTAYGYGIALSNMLVRHEYGQESNYPTLDTIQEVLTDAGQGVIPKYVEKVLTGDNSGYTINTTKVPALAHTTAYKYLYFPGKPAIKCLQDLVELYGASEAPNAGCHWIIVPSGTTAYLCLATVGNHENPPADVWPTWWNTDQAGSTIEVKKDMVDSRFEKQRSNANFVLFSGVFRRPANGDNWTENNAGDWGVQGNTVAENENGAGLYKVGSYSIRGRLANLGELGDIYYPSSADLNLNVENIGTENTIPRISFYARRNANADVSTVRPFLKIGTGAVANNNYFYYYCAQEMTNVDEWKQLSFPLGPYYDLAERAHDVRHFEWRTTGSPTWVGVDYIKFEFYSDLADARIYIDGLYISGIVTRAAQDTGLYSTQKARMFHIRDDIPKDDSLIASDDSGQIGQLCKGELYRAVTTPIHGRIVIPGKETIKAGQLCHIHFGKKSDGSFNINSDMRIIEVTHSFAPDGFRTYLTLTDDVKNSYPIQPTDAYNALLEAVKPGFQGRESSSIYAGQVDINQTVLKKSYTT